MSTIDSIPCSTPTTFSFYADSAKIRVVVVV